MYMCKIVVHVCLHMHLPMLCIHLPMCLQTYLPTYIYRRIYRSVRPLNCLELFVVALVVSLSIHLSIDLPSQNSSINPSFHPVIHAYMFILKRFLRTQRWMLGTIVCATGLFIVKVHHMTIATSKNKIVLMDYHWRNAPAMDWSKWQTCCQVSSVLVVQLFFWRPNSRKVSTPEFLSVLVLAGQTKKTMFLVVWWLVH